MNQIDVDGFDVIILNTFAFSQKRKQVRVIDKLW